MKIKVTRLHVFGSVAVIFLLTILCTLLGILGYTRSANGRAHHHDFFVEVEPVKITMIQEPTSLVTLLQLVMEREFENPSSYLMAAMITANIMADTEGMSDEELLMFCYEDPRMHHALFKSLIPRDTDMTLDEQIRLEAAVAVVCETTADQYKLEGFTRQMAEIYSRHEDTTQLSN